RPRGTGAVALGTAPGVPYSTGGRQHPDSRHGCGDRRTRWGQHAGRDAGGSRACPPRRDPHQTRPGQPSSPGGDWQLRTRHVGRLGAAGDAGRCPVRPFGRGGLRPGGRLPTTWYRRLRPRPRVSAPRGGIGSLASGGGFWNSAVHPEARQVILVSGTAAVLTLIGVIAAVSSTRTCARWGLVAAVGAPTLIVLLSVVAPLEPSWAVIL